MLRSRDVPRKLDVTAIIPNYRTRDLIQIAVESLLKFYPTLPMIVIDNGSQDASTEYIRLLPYGLWVASYCKC